MEKKSSIYIGLAIVLVLAVVGAELVILQLLPKTKTKSSAATKTLYKQPAPQQSAMCQSYMTAVPSNEQKQYLADVSEGFVAYERGLIANIENTITWRGRVNKILLNQNYATRSCVPGDKSSCQDIQLPHMNLIELKSEDGSTTDVPIIFEEGNMEKLEFWLYSDAKKTFDKSSFQEVARTLSGYAGTVEVKRTTLFNPTRKVLYVTRLST